MTWRTVLVLLVTVCSAACDRDAVGGPTVTATSEGVDASVVATSAASASATALPSSNPSAITSESVAVVVSPTPPTTAPPAINTCPTAELRLVRTSHDAGLGNRALDFDVVHDGVKPCVIEGYPQIALLDAKSVALKSPIYYGGGTYFTAVPAIPRVTLAAKGRAHFEIGYHGTAVTCPVSKTLRATIGSLTLSAPAEIQACDTDGIVVTPILTGVSPKGMP